MTSLFLLVLYAATPAPEAPDLAALWRDACLWEVGANAEKVPAARRALIAEGERSLAFLIPHQLDTKDTLVTRALDVVITGIGKSAAEALVKSIDSDNANVRRNVADLLGSLGVVEAAPAIAKLLGDPDARLGALAALGKLKATAATSAVARVMHAEAPDRVRYTAALTLGQIGGEEAIAALGKELGATSAPLRFAAQYALEGVKAVAALRARLGDADPRVRLHAVAALGHIGDASVRADLMAFLDDGDGIVRGFAIEALTTMLDEDVRARFERLLAVEQHPFARGKVLAALQRTD